MLGAWKEVYHKHKEKRDKSSDGRADTVTAPKNRKPEEIWGESEPV